jgi:hypothetical protein
MLIELAMQNPLGYIPLPLLNCETAPTREESDLLFYLNKGSAVPAGRSSPFFWALKDLQSAARRQGATTLDQWLLLLEYLKGARTNNSMRHWLLSATNASIANATESGDTLRHLFRLIEKKFALGA